MLDLKNKKGIIFGSTGLIGSSLAIELTKLGTKLILQGKSKKKLIEIDNKLRKLKKKQILLQMDLCDLSFYKKLLKLVSSRFDSLDFLINVVGKFNNLSPLTHLSHLDWNELIEINLNSYWRTLKELEPLLQKSSKPRVIFISNKDISTGKAYHNIFSVAKAGLLTLAKVYSDENKRLGIETKLIELDKLNFGMTQKLASIHSPVNASTEKITKKIILKCFSDKKNSFKIKI
tara:strand:- start:168 stop:863 length:696 start_codon:yes stop_codon:yes gene_type:complete